MFENGYSNSITTCQDCEQVKKENCLKNDLMLPNDVQSETIELDKVRKSEFLNINEEVFTQEKEKETELIDIENEINQDKLKIFIERLRKINSKKVVISKRKFLIKSFKRIIFLPIGIYIIFITCIDKILDMILSVFNNVLSFLHAYIFFVPQSINKKIFQNTCIFIFLIFTFVKSRNEKYNHTYRAENLFSRHSLVTDFFYGELNQLQDYIQHSDISIVMYYAPWDRQSLNFAPNFEEVSYHFYEQVTFSAINCWLPKSECRKAFKINRYPVIIMYIKLNFFKNSFMIGYPGPLTSYHLINYISKAIRPYIHIQNIFQLQWLRKKHDNFVLGYFLPTDFNSHFLRYYLASLQRLQYEKLQDIPFAVISNSDLAQKLYFTQSPSVYLVTKDHTLEMPYLKYNSVHNFTEFISKYMPLSNISQFIKIDEIKSFTLSKYLNDGFVFILFTPDNPFYRNNDFVSLIKIIATQFSECENDAKTNELHNLFYRTYDEIKNILENCQKYLKFLSDKSFKIIFSKKDYCTTEKTSSSKLLPSRWLSYGLKDYLSYFSSISESLGLENWSFLKHNSFDKTSEKFNRSHARQESYASFKNLINDGPILDDRVQKLINLKLENSCKDIYHGSLLSNPAIIQEELNTKKIVGLGCTENKTLHFLIIDSILNSDLAQHYGVKLDKKYKTGAVIFDAKNEEHYTFKSKISQENLVNFIYDFTKRQLKRHYFSSNNVLVKPDTVQHLFILELGTKSYMKLFKTPYQASLILHYTSNCGMCGAIGNELLKFAHILQDITNVTLARIDVSKNTLPWNLDFESVPVLVWHPSLRKSETKIFDLTKMVTVKNLLAFILPEIPILQRINMMKKICGESCEKFW